MTNLEIDALNRLQRKTKNNNKGHKTDFQYPNIVAHGSFLYSPRSSPLKISPDLLNSSRNREEIIPA